MITLNNHTINAQYGEPINWAAQFTPANATQGLGCMGDDGIISIGVLPDGLTGSDGGITGTPTVFGQYQTTLEIIGTDELCENQVVYFQTTVYINIEAPVFYWSKNPIYVSVPVTGNYNKLTYTLLAETHFLSGNFEELMIGEAFVKNGQLSMFLHDELDSLLESEKIAVGTTAPVLSFKLDQLVRRFYLHLTGTASDGQALDLVTPLSVVVLGGLLEIDYFIQRDSFWLEYFEKNIWLQFRARPKKTSLQSPEYVFAFCANSSVVFTYYLADGSTVSFSWICEPLRLHAIPVMQAAPANTVKITAQMQRNAALYGEPLVWLIDPQPQAHERFILFRNSYGMLETLRCTGQLSEQYKRASVTKSERFIYPNQNIEYSREFAWKSQSSSRECSLSTGWIGLEYRQYLALQLMETAEAYFFEPVSQALIPIELTAKNLDAYQDDEYLFALSLEFNYLI